MTKKIKKIRLNERKNIKAKLVKLLPDFDNDIIKKESFMPDKEWLDFACDFCKTFKKLPPGRYKSKKGNYQIEYLINFDSKYSEQNIITDARVAHSTGLVQISKEQVAHEKYTENYMFFILLWSKAAYCEGENSILKADKTALNYYMLTRRPAKEIIHGLIHTSSRNPNLQLFKERLDQAFLILQ